MRCKKSSVKCEKSRGQTCDRCRRLKMRCTWPAEQPPILRDVARPSSREPTPLPRTESSRGESLPLGETSEAPPEPLENPESQTPPPPPKKARKRSRAISAPRKAEPSQLKGKSNGEYLMLIICYIYSYNYSEHQPQENQDVPRQTPWDMPAATGGNAELRQLWRQLEELERTVAVQSCIIDRLEARLGRVQEPGELPTQSLELLVQQLLRPLPAHHLLGSRENWDRTGMQIEESPGALIRGPPYTIYGTPRPSEPSALPLSALINIMLSERHSWPDGKCSKSLERCITLTAS